MDIKNQLILASKAYTDDIVQRAVISNIPVIGSTIDLLFTEKWAKYQQERLNIFNKLIIEEFEHIDENMVNISFLKSEEFFDLIVSLMENSLKTRHKERISLFSKLLKNKVLKDFFSKFDSDDFVSTINELIPRDIIIIKDIKNIEIELDEKKRLSAEPDKFSTFIDIDDINKISEFTKEEILLSMTKLIKLGLIIEFFIPQFGLSKGNNYKTTKYLQDLLMVIAE